MSLRTRSRAGVIAFFLIVSGCGSDSAGTVADETVADETVASSPPTAAETPTSNAQWCSDFLVFDEQPTEAAIPAILGSAPADIASDLEVLIPLLQAVANYDDEEPGAEGRLADLRAEPGNKAATDRVNAFVNANC